MQDARFDALRRVADGEIVRAIEAAVESGTDASLTRIDPLHFAEARRFSDEKTIDAFVQAAKLGLFEMSWNLLCPACGGVLDAGANLKQVRDSYDCALCAVSYEPTLDEMVEVSFTVSPGVRRVAAHDPDSMSLFDYFRYMHFANTLVMPRDEDYAKAWENFTVEAEPVPPGEKVILSVQVPPTFTILFEPITHHALFLDVQGEPTKERRDVTIVFSEAGSVTDKQILAPGPLRLTLVNRTNRRILPGLFAADETFHEQFSHRRPFLTAKRLFTNQTFRDLYRTEAINIDQRLKIANLTVLFTDLKGSTELYERVGDLAAYDLVREHFRVLADVVREQSGAVVKTIGDAVMATFDSARDGMNAALRMRDAMEKLNTARQHEDLLVKIGLHSGPCLAVISNERLDYFGQTVNIASRVQGLATSRTIFVTEPIVDDAGAKEVLSTSGLTPQGHRALLRGIADELTVYEIP